MASTLNVAGTITGVNASLTTADNSDNLTLKSTDADADKGPNLVLQRDSSSPADGDVTGFIEFKVDNDAGEATSVGEIKLHLSDASDGTEDSQLNIRTMSNGALQNRMSAGATSTVFNNDAIDLDLVVKSNNDANCLFVDGGNDKVGIGTNAPQGFLSINKNSNGSALPHIHLIDNSDAREAFITNNAGDLILGTMNSSDDTIDSSVTVLTSSIVLRTAGTDRMSIDANGKVQIGSSTANGFIHLKQNFQNDIGMALNDSSGSGGTAMRFQVNGSTKGEIAFNTSSTTFATSSDYRLKENVTTSWDATTRLKQLKPSRFNFIADADTTVDGFLAHEVSSIVPEAITGTKDGTEDITNVVLNADGTVNSDGVSQSDWTAGKSDETYANDTTWVASKTIPKYQGIDQSKLVPLLVKTIQELEARIKALEDA
jgi:hypothetical protein